jgi:hypothetical protein
LGKEKKEKEALGKRLAQRPDSPSAAVRQSERIVRKRFTSAGCRAPSTKTSAQPWTRSLCTEGTFRLPTAGYSKWPQRGSATAETFALSTLRNMKIKLWTRGIILRISGAAKTLTLEVGARPSSAAGTHPTARTSDTAAGESNPTEWPRRTRYERLALRK